MTFSVCAQLYSTLYMLLMQWFRGLDCRTRNCEITMPCLMLSYCLPAPLQATLSKLLNYSALGSTQPPPLSRTVNEY